MDLDEWLMHVHWQCLYYYGCWDILKDIALWYYYCVAGHLDLVLGIFHLWWHQRISSGLNTPPRLEGSWHFIASSTTVVHFTSQQTHLVPILCELQQSPNIWKPKPWKPENIWELCGKYHRFYLIESLIHLSGILYRLHWGRVNFTGENKTYHGRTMGVSLLSNRASPSHHPF